MRNQDALLEILELAKSISGVAATRIEYISEDGVYLIEELNSSQLGIPENAKVLETTKYVEENWKPGSMPSGFVGQFPKTGSLTIQGVAFSLEGANHSTGYLLLLDGATQNFSALQKEQLERLARLASNTISANGLVRTREQGSFPKKNHSLNFYEFLDLSPVGVALVTLKSGKFLEVNSALANAAGYTKAELKNLTFWDITPEEYHEEEGLEMQKLRRDTHFGPFQKEYIRKDGSRFPVLLKGIKFLNENKDWLVLSVIQDISDQKRTEEQLKEAKEAAENANKAKSDFLANMSHEIRTPLNGVIGFTDLLMKTPLTETQLQYMSTVHHSAHSLLDLINDILDFSKIEAGKMELSLEKSDIFRLGSQVSDVTKYQAHSKGLELVVKISPYLPRYFYLDDVRVRQILINLLTNAIKFTQKGEVLLEVRELKKEDTPSGTYRFSVKDTGIGIPKEKQSKIFEAFAQEDATTSRKYGGSGLGLAISNKLLGLMGSELKLKSTLGEGSEFYFDLEVVTEDGASNSRKKELSIKHVLVVDDNSTNRELILEVLSGEGIKVDEVENGMAALEFLANGNKVDLILMDYRMPYLNGLETTKKIRQANFPDASDIPIMLLSSSNEDDWDETSFATLNIHQKLIKPLRSEQLFEAFHALDFPDKKEENPLVTLKFEPSFEDKEFSIIVAEDNPVNMKLTKVLLSKIGPNFQIRTVENGLEAYEEFVKEPADLILMDVQMPVMNGYEAAQAIRDLPSGEKVPIVSLTAGTVSGEKERCLEAGMSDYLSKPVVHTSLVNMLLKWLIPSHENREGHYDSPATMSGATRFDPEHLISLFDGDREIGNELLKIAIQSFRDGISQLEEALANGDFHSIKVLGHKLKGSAATAGFFKLLPITEALIASTMKDEIRLEALSRAVLEELRMIIQEAKVLKF